MLFASPQTLTLALLLALVFSFFSPRIQHRLQSLFRSRPSLLCAVPVLLTAIFAAASLLVRAFSPSLTALVFLYCCLPAACVFFRGPDFLAIALLWLPIEFAAGAALVPKAAQGF